MLLELLLAITLGITAGTFTGLIPGVHINLVAGVLMAIAPILASKFPLILVAVLIVGMSITHNFVDMVPAIFLGAPEDETALGVLPGHRYLLLGQGLMAIKLTVIGGILGTLIVTVLFIPSMWLLEFLLEHTRNVLFWLLLSMVLFMVYKDRKRSWALMIFLISGLLGIVTLRLPLKDPLLPLLSGIFGVATLLYSIKEENHIPEQKDLPYTRFDRRKTILGSILGSLGAFLTALYPGVSSAMAAAVVSAKGRLGDHGFMVLLGALGSAGFVLSLAAYLSIAKPRNGAMLVVTEITQIDVNSAVLLIGVVLIATGFAALLTLRLGRAAASFLPRIDYFKTCIAVIVFILFIVAIRTGWLGLIVLATSTAVGLLPATLKTARAQGMGALLLPILVVLW